MEKKYVIVRADRAGVFFGLLESKTSNEVTLTECRKLYYWDGANTVEDISVNGVKEPENCKFTITVNEITISNWIQILPCARKAIASIKNVKEWTV